jgi:hypothetical protein
VEPIRNSSLFIGVSGGEGSAEDLHEESRDSLS